MGDISVKLDGNEHVAEQLARDKVRDDRLSRLEAMEDRIYEKAADIIDANLSFDEVRPDTQEPPPSWIAKYGREMAYRRVHLARVGWYPAADQPSAIKLAQQVMAGIQRGRGHRVSLTQNQLNVKISLPAPTSREHPGPEVYEVRDVEE